MVGSAEPLSPSPHFDFYVTCELFAIFAVMLNIWQAIDMPPRLDMGVMVESKNLRWRPSHYNRQFICYLQAFHNPCFDQVNHVIIVAPKHLNPDSLELILLHRVYLKWNHTLI